MALFVNQNSNRSKLQEKLVAELNEKARKKAQVENAGSPDGVEDSAYMEGMKQTTSLAWLWILITFIAVGAVIWLVIVAVNR